MGLLTEKGKWFMLTAQFLREFLKTVKRLRDRELAKFTTTDKYYALVIGNNKYKNKEALEAAANDAKVISNILQDKYGFEVTTLIDADYSSIVDNLIEFTKNKKDR